MFKKNIFLILALALPINFSSFAMSEDLVQADNKNEILEENKADSKIDAKAENKESLTKKNKKSHKKTKKISTSAIKTKLNQIIASIVNVEAQVKKEIIAAKDLAITQLDSKRKTISTQLKQTIMALVAQIEAVINQVKPIITSEIETVEKDLVNLVSALIVNFLNQISVTISQNHSAQLSAQGVKLLAKAKNAQTKGLSEQADKFKEQASVIIGELKEEETLISQLKNSTALDLNI